MKREEFLVELEDILQRDKACKETDLLDEYDEWDSLSKMAIMAFYNKNFGITVTLNDLKALKTVADLINLAGDKFNG